MKNYKAYFETTPIGEQLKIKAELNALKQEDAIELLFKATRKTMTPSEILEMYPTNVPITSIRRAITQLTKKGFLVQTDMTKKSPWGRPEHFWIHADYEHLI